MRCEHCDRNCDGSSSDFQQCAADRLWSETPEDQKTCADLIG